jgi:hypothetical protein
MYSTKPPRLQVTGASHASSLKNHHDKQFMDMLAMDK